MRVPSKPQREGARRWSDTPTPYAIICYTCGQVYMTNAEYERQLSNPDATWVCPRCGARHVAFDDDTYNKFCQEEEQNAEYE